MSKGYLKCDFETEVPEGWFKIAWYISMKDVHWLRRDDDGKWSHNSELPRLIPG